MEYKLGVVGSPIEHSLSPEIHNIFAQELNIKISYEKYLVNAGELSSFCNQFFDNPNALGLNVTLPLKKEVLDPQGKVVSQTLKNMGYDKIASVRQGKYFEIEIDENDKEKAKKLIEEISKKLLTNLVIEDYKISLD